MGSCKCMLRLFTLDTCKCRCKKIRCVSENDLHLHGITCHIYDYWQLHTQD
jgi:hypothetical protein